MITILPAHGLPEVAEGTDLPCLLADHFAANGPALQAGDVVVVTQKIVSKAEGRFVALDGVAVSDKARELALAVNKDARLVELVLRESQSVVRTAPNVLITRHRLGHVMANAGIDASNIGAGKEDWVLLLPEDPDASAALIAAELSARFGFAVPVLIADSFGRPWRMGTVNVAIGLYGMVAVQDQRGERDRDGRVMQVTQPAIADAVAAAAGLAMGEAAEGVPVAVVRGLNLSGPAQTSAAILRPQGEDLFR
jgi:coenzyme F420-0:L-glutamate ligase/coenzyme F420-1:gamma-L-glutamate ligase